MRRKRTDLSVAILERRVRVMRAAMPEGYELPVLQAMWPADPIWSPPGQSDVPWARYKPIYDEEPLPKDRRIEEVAR